MARYLLYLAKVRRGIKRAGLLVPTIFLSAVGAGLGYVIIIIKLFIFRFNQGGLYNICGHWVRTYGAHYD